MPRNRLTPQQRNEMLKAYLDKSKSSGQLSIKYGVNSSYVRFLAHMRKNGSRTRQGVKPEETP